MNQWRTLADRLSGIYRELEKLAEDFEGQEQEEFTKSLCSSLAPFFEWKAWERLWEDQGKSLPPLDEATVVIALSFGLEPDGAPGKTNEQLTEVIEGLVNDGMSENRVYAQWEIADVLEARGTKIPDENVTWPPPFEGSQIRHPRRLIERLYSARNMRNRPTGYIYNRLSWDAQQRVNQYMFGLEALDPDRIAQDLNELLDVPDFCSGYLDAVPEKDRLALCHLDRGASGYERRVLPERTVADDMGRGQVQRVNRLILESIFPDELDRGEYLSTWDVCVQMSAAKGGIERVILVAHPDHIYRCYELVKDFASAQGVEWDILVADCRKVKYDPESAQSWTRSPSNFWRCEIWARQEELMRWWDRPSTQQGTLTD